MWQCPPLSKRIFISKASFQYHQSNGSFPDRPETYNLWKPEAMEKLWMQPHKESAFIGQHWTMEYQNPI